ncbi:hypothetical protein LIER_25927 [Lithospermum erythrorhizon]|uniref:Uncharacterized protein n=1 Tax=Lithospermum erythrorhizon TaxID=34254 RepID=A0AAV3RCH0_LITER
MTPVGGPDGKLVVYSLGSKSLHEWMHDELSLDLIVQRTGKHLSPLNIYIGLNKKKYKATDEPTGNFYNPRLEQAYYDCLFLEQYGENADLLQAPWDKMLWMKTKPVRARLGKCRMLGAATSFAEPLMDGGPSYAAPAPMAVIEDLKRRLSEEEARNKVLEQKYEER